MYRKELLFLLLHYGAADGIIRTKQVVPENKTNNITEIPENDVPIDSKRSIFD